MSSKKIFSNAKRAMEGSTGMQIHLTNGGFTTVSEEWYDYLNQWKWFRLDLDGGHAARFEYNLNGDLTLIYMEDEIMGSPSCLKQFEELEDELRPFAANEPFNIFDREKYENWPFSSCSWSPRPFTVPHETEGISEHERQRIGARAFGEHMIFVCPHTGGGTSSRIKAINRRIKRWATKAIGYGLVCCLDESTLEGEELQSLLDDPSTVSETGGANSLESDALIIVNSPDKVADKSSDFGTAVAEQIPIFDVSAAPIRIWDYSTKSFVTFCKRSAMYTSIKAYLDDYWAVQPTCPTSELEQGLEGSIG